MIAKPLMRSGPKCRLLRNIKFKYILFLAKFSVILSKIVTFLKEKGGDFPPQRIQISGPSIPLFIPIDWWIDRFVYKN